MMISTRLVELAIDTVVCLTLAKWETVPGRFGGYLTALPPSPAPREELVRCNVMSVSNQAYRHAELMRPPRGRATLVAAAADTRVISRPAFTCSAPMKGLSS